MKKGFFHGKTLKALPLLVRPAGFEPATYGFVDHTRGNWQDSNIINNLLNYQSVKSHLRSTFLSLNIPQNTLILPGNYFIITSSETEVWKR